MSQIQPAGGRLLQSLQSRISPSTQDLFAGTPLVPAAPKIQPQPDGDLDESQKLAIFDEVLQQVESGAVSDPQQFQDVPAVPVQAYAASPQQTIVSALDPDAVYQPTEDSGLFAQAIPTAIDHAQQQAEQQLTQVGGHKERLEGGSANGVVAPELAADIQYVEEEKTPELPPEVESYIQHVEEAAKIEPQNIVIAQDSMPAAPAVPTPPRIVKVLPLTKEQEEVGLRKSTSFSIRWLVEFGHKVAKALVGNVVYRES